MRPRKFYVVHEHGRATAVIEGSTAAKKRSAWSRPFQSRLDAEEYAAWWNYADSPFASDKAQALASELRSLPRNKLLTTAAAALRAVI